MMLESQIEKVLPFGLVSPFGNLVCLTALSCRTGGYFFALLPRAYPALKHPMHTLKMLNKVSTLMYIAMSSSVVFRLEAGENKFQEKGQVFEKDHYEDLRKVYSIWVCMNVTKDKRNTVTVYNLNEHDIIGARKAKKEDYDLICMVMIGFGDPEETEPGTMLNMLDVLFSNKINASEKKGLLEDKCGIPMKEEKLAEEVETMCNLGQGI